MSRETGHEIKRGLRRIVRRRQLVALAFVAPLLVFTLAVFVVPIGEMLRLAVWNAEFSGAMPDVAGAMQAWKAAGHHGVPDEEVFAALAQDLRAAVDTPAAASAARRLNYDLDRGRSLITGTAASIAAMETPQQGWKEELIALDARWGLPETWAAINRARSSLTDFFLLAAVDLQRDDAGHIVPRPADRAIYLDVLVRTLTISLTVTLACLLLAFPVAYLLARQPPSRANFLLILVLLPFWTPLLVRTAAWVVILQENGLVNQALETIRLIDSPVRLLYNRGGVVIAMTHVLLPFMILPLYSVMKGVPNSFVRASYSLGAPPLTTFRRVYLPQVMPGVSAGTLLVFILALGYYITPALVGGPSDQMISYFIAFNTNQTLNWSLAAALGSVLLLATIGLFLISTLTGGRKQLGVLG